MRDDVRVLLIDFEHLERDVAPAFAFKGGVMRGVGRSLDNQHRIARQERYPVADRSDLPQSERLRIESPMLVDISNT